MKLQNAILAFALGLLMNACGQSEYPIDTADESNLQSLVGFPCQDYSGFNPQSDSFVCTQVNIGSGKLDVLYRLDGFNTAQKTKLKQALTAAMRTYSDYWIAPQGAPLLSCIVRNAKEALDPQGSTLSPSFKELDRKGIWALTTLAFGFQFHVDTHQPIVVTAFDENLDASGVTAMARAAIGTDRLPVTTDMNFLANRTALNQPATSKFDYSANAFAGAMVHEMLHRKGYVHASSGRSVGPMVYEVGNCISDLKTGLGLTGRKPLPRAD